MIKLLTLTALAAIMAASPALADHYDNMGVSKEKHCAWIAEMVLPDRHKKDLQVPGVTYVTVLTHADYEEKADRCYITFIEYITRNGTVLNRRTVQDPKTNVLYASYLDATDDKGPQCEILIDGVTAQCGDLAGFERAVKTHYGIDVHIPEGKPTVSNLHKVD